MAMKKKRLRSLFVDLGKKGDVFQGVYRGYTSRPNRLGEGEQKIWNVTATKDEGKAKQSERDGGGSVKILAGTNYFIGEKTTLINVRLDLTEGQEFRLECLGKVKSSEGGREYLDFDFFTEGGN